MSSINRTYGRANWWITLIKGVLLVIFGIWLLKSPVENLTKLSVLFGVLIVIGGLLEIWLAFNNRQAHKRWEWTLTSGILDVILGAFLIANPSFILLLITILVSIWLLIRGIILVRNALVVKKAGNENYIYGLIFGIVLIVIAAIFAWHPEALGITIAFWMALSFISLGILRIILVFKFN